TLKRTFIRTGATHIIPITSSRIHRFIFTQLIEKQFPDGICFSIGFEHLTYEDRYFRYPCMYLDQETDAKMETKHLQVPDPAHKKFCNFVYSNGEADPIRELFFDKLSEYKTVDSGGRYRNNVGGPCADKRAFQSAYKFSIAFENSSHSGYVTEKLIDAYAAGTIPIYWGDPRIEEYFDPESFIHITDEASIPAAIERIKAIDQDAALYRKVMETPALRDIKDLSATKQEELQKFLFHILDQPLEQAYRHNRVFWGKYYLDQQVAYVNSYHELMNFKTKIKRLLPPWRKQ
nr:hypothetical protein [Lachnospiraceae bacterium]